MISKSLLDKIYSIVDPQEYIQGNININEIKDLFGNNMLSYVEIIEDIDYLISKGINIHNKNNFNENVLFGTGNLLFHKDKELKDKKILIGIDLEEFKSTLNVLNFIKENCNSFTYRFLKVIYSKESLEKEIISINDYHNEVEEIIKYLEKEKMLINLNVI